MVNYKASAAALIAAASMASAQNVTIISGTNGTVVSPNNGNGGTNINVSIDISFTQTFAQLCPTGLTDVEYVFTQHCPGGCPSPTPYGVPNGWVVTTAACTVCGPQTSVVTITTCPYANATPTPVAPNACPTCYTDVVRYTPPPACNTCAPPPCTTVTNVYPPPTTPVVPLTYTISTCTNTPVVPATITSAVPPPVYTSVCPGCPATPITPLSVSSVPVTVCNGCPKATPVTLQSVCNGCSKTTGTVPTPVTPPAYTGAAAKKDLGAGIMVAGVLAVAALL